jgi:hypothetical protein
LKNFNSFEDIFDLSDFVNEEEHCDDIEEGNVKNAVDLLKIKKLVID